MLYHRELYRYALRRVGRLVALPIRYKTDRFLRDCLEPERVQTELLLNILRRQSPTAFGRDHHFAAARTIADYRHSVPIAPYEYVAPYVERVQKGETDALIANDRVLLFALTSGTTAARKLIPITTRYLADYKRGWNFWGVKAYRDHRGRRLAFRPILQMVGDPEEYRTSAGIPCGNLSGYTALVQKKIIQWLYTVPPSIGKIKDSTARYYLALRCSVARPASMFLAANPSTLLMMARMMDQHKDSLLRDIHDGTLRDDLEISGEIRAAVARKLKAKPERARELARIAGKMGRLYPKDVWPDTGTLIGTWTGGSMGPYLRQLPQFFGEPPIRDLGLLASEGRMTIPFDNDTPAGVLDIWSHYFEFIPEREAHSENPVVLGAHELQEGQSYFIIPTTQSGLYRYQISDLIRVNGFLGRTPIVEFLGKGSRFSNMTGEKLSEHQVTQAMVAAMRQTGFGVGTYSVAPVWNDVQPYYGLFIEETDARDRDGLAQFLPVFDQALGELNIEYAAKRDGQRLGPVKAEILPNGAWAEWDRSRLAKTGGSPEQYKHPCLIGDLAFASSMTTRREVA